MPQKTQPAAGRRWILLALVVLIALNLRPFLTAPGPVLTEIVVDTGMGYSSLALLTLLPMMLMGVGAFISPVLQAIIGTRRGILIALLVLAAGSLLRLVAPDGTSLILTAALCGAGVAFIQAAFPGIIKAEFPRNIPVVTGLYSAMLMGGGALGARLTPLLVNHGFGWRSALALLAAPALIAFGAAFFILSDSRSRRPDKTLTGRLLRRPRTWTLILAFGLVNAGYSSVVAWLAPYYQTLGWSNGDSGSLVALMAICQAVAALGLPILARRSIDRRSFLSLTLLMQAVGFAGLAFLPQVAPIVWVGLCGAGLGSSFALAIVTALDHLPRPEEAGVLVALMQGGGFLLASLGPFATAFLHDISGSFAAGWMMHLVCIASVLFLYLRFNPAHYAQAMQVQIEPPPSSVRQGI
ncbi:cyanate transporter [Rhizobium sp. ARZ01]|uniref:cyanate transporter n=1 Tax=Rhizobium sp. ARZ01 TaxID=2769313 RepID=UPI00177F7B1E|nr:cyanate transporter [Rhizobium sp. ARZ01]MBD9372730.1 cyanate transporter [Rhizobium sp. ARZ01]